MRRVDKSILTHAHSDHAKRVSSTYLSSKDSELLLKTRLGEDISLQTIDYNNPLKINGVTVTFIPAGHILGSSQIKVEGKSGITVFTGDYAILENPTCSPFESVKCDTFITESTFALPIYKWENPESVFQEINKWWRENTLENKTSILFCYSLGKAQRVLSGLDESIGTIFTHTTVEKLNYCYRKTGVSLPKTTILNNNIQKSEYRGSMIIAPQSALSENWVLNTDEISTGYASGWMHLKAFRKRSNVDRGFVLSDHADFNGLNYAVQSSGASKIMVTHGFTSQYVRYLNELGINAEELSTDF